MRVRILGSAAGGGVPQWNCRCPNCAAARAGISQPDAPARVAASLAGASGSDGNRGPHVRPRTQSSLAISADDRTWFLLNVSPDIRQQILAFPSLGPPAGTTRGQAIAGCVLTDGELDHTTGLLLVREGESFPVFSTALVRSWLNRFFPVEPVLSCFAMPTWHHLPLDRAVELTRELRVRAFAVEPHRPRFVTNDASSLAGSVIGLVIEDQKTGGKLLYAPCVGSLNEPLLTLARQADAVLIDGTFWSDDEPLRFGKRTALEMGHVPVSGPHGSLAWLRDLSSRHRVYIHINNTNPMLNEAGIEFRAVIDAGVRVGADGDEFHL